MQSLYPLLILYNWQDKHLFIITILVVIQWLSFRNSSIMNMHDTGCVLSKSWSTRPVETCVYALSLTYPLDGDVWWNGVLGKRWQWRRAAQHSDRLHPGAGRRLEERFSSLFASFAAQDSSGQHFAQLLAGIRLPPSPEKHWNELFHVELESR